MKWMRLIALGFWLSVGASRLWADDSAEATITVTPVADVSLSLSLTTYAFGPTDVNTSTITATGLTLSNNGEVDIKVSKKILIQSNPAGWTADTSVGLDRYVLWLTTATTRPTADQFSAATQFGVENQDTPLTGAAGVQPTVTPLGGALPTVDLWFKLDMPSHVSSQTPREISVRFTGVAQ